MTPAAALGKPFRSPHEAFHHSACFLSQRRHLTNKLRFPSISAPRTRRLMRGKQISASPPGYRLTFECPGWHSWHIYQTSRSAFRVHKQHRESFYKLTYEWHKLIYARLLKCHLFTCWVSGWEVRDHMVSRECFHIPLLYIDAFLCLKYSVWVYVCINIRQMVNYHLLLHMGVNVSYEFVVWGSLWGQTQRSWLAFRRD